MRSQHFGNGIPTFWFVLMGTQDMNDEPLERMQRIYREISAIESPDYWEVIIRQ